MSLFSGALDTLGTLGTFHKIVTHGHAVAGLNATLKESRDEDPLQFLGRVSGWVGKKMAEHARESEKFLKAHPLTPHARGLWEEQNAICATTRYDFHETGPRCYCVTNLGTGNSHEVTWDNRIELEWSCVCASFIDFRVPCRHIRVVMHNKNVSPLLPENVRRFWPSWARSEVYHAAYRASGVRTVPIPKGPFRGAEELKMKRPLQKKKGRVDLKGNGIKGVRLRKRRKKFCNPATSSIDNMCRECCTGFFFLTLIQSMLM